MSNHLRATPSLKGLETFLVRRLAVGTAACYQADACSREQWTLKTEQRKLKASAGAPVRAGAPILSSIRRTTTSVFVPSSPKARAGALQMGRGIPKGVLEISMESLILAQDERWRRASHMQVERGSFGGNTGEGLVANGCVTREEPAPKTGITAGNR